MGGDEGPGGQAGRQACAGMCRHLLGRWVSWSVAERQSVAAGRLIPPVAPPPKPLPACLQVQVPPFVQRGDAVVVDTAERTFVRRG